MSNVNLKHTASVLQEAQEYLKQLRRRGKHPTEVLEVLFQAGYRLKVASYYLNRIHEFLEEDLSLNGFLAATTLGGDIEESKSKVCEGFVEESAILDVKFHFTVQDNGDFYLDTGSRFSAYGDSEEEARQRAIELLAGARLTYVSTYTLNGKSGTLSDIWFRIRDKAIEALKEGKDEFYYAHSAHIWFWKEVTARRTHFPYPNRRGARSE